MQTRVPHRAVLEKAVGREGAEDFLILFQVL